MLVSDLSLTPVKGLALDHPPYVDLDLTGVVGDRVFYLIDAAGEVISCTDLGDLFRYRASFDPDSDFLNVHGPDGFIEARAVSRGLPVMTDFYGLRSVSGHVVNGWDELFSDIAGQPLQLVIGTSAGFDVSAVTILGAASVQALAETNSVEPITSSRFRMNIEFAGGRAHEEDDWKGCELALGTAVVRVGGPVRRCAATTRNPETGAVDLQTLAMIGAARGRQETPEFGKGFYFGVYADVISPGRIYLNSEVSLVK